MRRLGVLLALCALSGCHVVFGFDNDLPARDDGAEDAPCSSIQMIANDFDDGQLPWAFDAERTAIVDGELAMTPSPNTYATLDGMSWFDALGTPITFRLRDEGIGSGSYAVIVFETDRPLERVEVWRTGSLLNFVVDNDASPNSTSIPYDPIQHAYISVLFADGLVTLATSPDGDAYTMQVSRPLADVRYVHMNVRVFRAIDQPEVTLFLDDLLGGTPAGVACSASEIAADFEAPVLDRMWVESGHNSNASIEEGQLVIDVAAGQPATTEYKLRTRRLYNFVDKEVFLEIPQSVSGDAELRLFVRSRTQDEVRFVQAAGVLVATLQKPGASAMDVYDTDYVPAEMRWWKIQSSMGVTSWMVSPDGVEWDSFGSIGGVEGLEVAEIEIQVHNTSANAAQARIDNINTPP